MMFRTLEDRLKRHRAKRIAKALSRVERDIRDAQVQLASLGFGKDYRTIQIALRQELRRALHLIVKYQEVRGFIQPTEIDEHIKEPEGYAA